MTGASAALFERAERVLVGGVNSPVRAMRSIGRSPIFVDRAEGPHVWDVDGNRYVDYLATWGPAILGHAHPAVLADIRDALPRGTSYGAPTEREVVFAEAVAAAFPSIEQLRMTSSGSEAVLVGARPREVTGRSGKAVPAARLGGEGSSTTSCPNRRVRAVVSLAAARTSCQSIQNNIARNP